MYLYKHVHTGLNNVHTCLYSDTKMYVHVYTMYIHVHRFSELYIHVYTFHQMYVHVWTMYMMRMYYSIVHTHHIHSSDMYIHVYARWVGFQMSIGLWLIDRDTHLQWISYTAICAEHWTAASNSGQQPCTNLQVRCRAGPGESIKSSILVLKVLSLQYLS